MSLHWLCAWFGMMLRLDAVVGCRVGFVLFDPMWWDGLNLLRNGVGFMLVLKFLCTLSLKMEMLLC